MERKAASNSMLPLAKSRLWLVAAVFMVGYFAVALRLIDLTLLQSHHVDDPNLPHDIVPLGHPLRGNIVDRNGDLMATSLKMASVYADATMVENPAAVAQALARILPDENRATLEKHLASGKKFIWLHRDVTPKQEYAINALGIPALNFQEEDRRIYPGGDLAAHLVGYTDVDGSGIAGVEKQFDKVLKKGEEPVNLTIDMRIQHILHRELEQAVHKFSAKAGIGMVMDVNTGEIIAMVSLPDYDPHYPQGSSDEARFNRATLGVFEMGSTFKLFSTAAALDSGLVHFGSMYDAGKPIKYGRFTINDYHAKKRELSVPEIFIYSSNIGTAREAMVIGTQALQDFYKKMGFFAQAPVELPERGWPIYPKPWHEVNTLTASFGHGVAVSPLHLMRAASALVNGGTLIMPTIIKSDKTRPPEPVGERVVKPQTSAMIRQLMELVVAAGTGSNAYVEGYNVGGKTGTAEKNTGGHYVHSAVLSSFIGVFPIREPRYAVLAMVDEPKPIAETHGFVTGGWTAAPVVAHVIEQMAPLYQIAPSPDTERDIVKDMGMYLKDAKEGGHLAAPGNDH